MNAIIIRSIVSLLAISGGLFETYQSYRYVRTLRQTPNSATASFAPLALFTSIVFALILIGGGIAVAFGDYSKLGL